MDNYVFGIEWLDRNFSNILKLNPLILIAGHPGAGKTVLACTICYANALRGHKTLYITFQESKEKLFKVMSGLGMDLKDVEAREVFKFVKIPTILSIDNLSTTISRLINEYEPKVVVFDSINPILMAVGDESVKRALLQNFLYDLSEVVKGITIVVAELPKGCDDVGLNSIEFIADAVFILKHRVYKGLLTRVLEIRKVRASEVSIAEIPLKIESNLGLVLYPPPIIEEVSPEYGELELPCEVLKRVVGHIHKSMNVYITYPPDARIPHIAVIPISIALINNLKVLVITYMYSSDILKSQLIRVLGLIGLKGEEFEELIDRHVVIRSINPTSYSLDELLIRELTLVDSIKDIDVVAFHDVSLTSRFSEVGEYLVRLYNILNYLRLKKLLVVRLGSYVNDEIYRFNTLLSSLVMKYEPVFKDGKFVGVQAYVWRRGTTPYIITPEELAKCYEEIGENIRRRCISSVERS